MRYPSTAAGRARTPGRPGGSMEFRLLGPVELWHDGRLVDIGHAKQRCVLAVLLMEAGRVVPTGTLLDRVWGHAPPDAALNVLYGYIARLRKALAPAGAALARRSGGYLLDAPPERVDVHRFRRLLREAESADPGRRLSLLDEALTLWRGTPFAGVAGPWIATTRRVLEDQRLSAVVARNEVCLRAGRHAEIITQLLELVAAYPSDERLVGQLMLAMSRAGRSSAALDQYRLVRQRLRDQYGRDPGPPLREIHQHILSRS
jgi:DNA-binding SARP family transcriptional activator